MADANNPVNVKCPYILPFVVLCCTHKRNIKFSPPGQQSTIPRYLLQRKRVWGYYRTFKKEHVICISGRKDYFSLHKDSKTPHMKTQFSEMVRNKSKPPLNTTSHGIDYGIYTSSRCKDYRTAFHVKSMDPSAPGFMPAITRKGSIFP